MYRILQQSVLERIRKVIAEKYGVEPAAVAVEQPPKIALGELALPVAFELAKRLKKAPRAIAAELQTELAGLPGVAAVEIAGAGYLNIRLERAEFAARMAQDEHADVGGAGFRLVEHTSINPNKAAHIGHLRNAILGDTFQRLLRRDEYKSGYALGVQNYIDNTGVQVADVVVGFTNLPQVPFKTVTPDELKTPQGILKMIAELAEAYKATGDRECQFDYYCWGLYSRVTTWYLALENNPFEVNAVEAEKRKKLRLDTLHALEQGGNETAEMAEVVAMAVLRRHLETMQRLGIEYDFLPRESEILHLHFWEHAFALMKEKGVLYLETEGKNKGCWVMKRAGSDDVADGPDEDAKIIVRSNGTVTYVGKDIAYHLWKFGLLGLDFGYAKFHEYPTHTCWISAMQGEKEHPYFGKADAVYNVIDSRQNDPQNNVRLALRGMGYTEAADRFTHVNYEMVALSPRCAADLGYALSDEDKLKPFIEVSGRKGFGVKADDLLDKLIAAAKAEVDGRNAELGEEARAETARRIAIGALRYFMLKFTRNSMIVFDYQDALSFEGETGPYVQYAVVRAANIFRKAGVQEADALAWMSSDEAKSAAAKAFAGEEGDGLWELWLTASRLTTVLEQSIAAAEPAYLAKYAFQLAQQFNNFYHRYNILKETDAGRRRILLASAAVAKRELTRALGWLGIQAPDVM